MYSYDTFCIEREGKIAKNLLLNHICDNCYFLHGGVMKCDRQIDLFSYESADLPEVRTCINWKIDILEI